MMDFEGERRLDEFADAIHAAIRSCAGKSWCDSPAFPHGLWVEMAYELALAMQRVLRRNAPDTWGRDDFDMPRTLGDFLRWRTQSAPPRPPPREELFQGTAQSPPGDGELMRTTK